MEKMLAFIKTEKGQEVAYYPALKRSRPAGNSQPEEPVRMEAYNNLITEYGYPPNRIEIEFPVRIRDDEQPRFADIVVFDDEECKRPLIVVEAKQPKREDGELQGQRYASILRAVYVLWTNGNTSSASVLVNRYPEEAVPIKDIPKFGGILQNSIQDLVPFEDNRGLSTVIRQCHNLIRSLDKKNPNDAFMEFLKILAVKFEDEYKESDYEFQVFLRGSPPKQESENETAQRVRAAFHEIVTRETNINSRVWNEHEDISLSNESIYQIVKILQKYNFSATPVDQKARAFETFLSGKLRKEFKEYMTPRVVVESIIEMADISVKDTILDPCCGTAAFLTYALKHLRDKMIPQHLTPEQKAKRIFDFAHDSLYGLDDSEQMALVSKLNMLINEDGRAHIFKHDSLYKRDDAPAGLAQKAFDLIMTNPPFGTHITGPKALLQSFRIVRTITERKKGYLTEVLFLERNLEWLKPNGQMFIILPDSVLSNVNLAEARKLIETHARLKAVISLSPDTFGPAGAKSKTSIVVLQKWKIGEDNSRADELPVFIANVRNIGYDFTGRKTEGRQELPEIVSAYKKWSPNTEVQESTCFKVVSRKEMGSHWLAQPFFAGYEYDGETVRLGSICSFIRSGKTPSRSEYKDAGIIITKVGNLTGSGIEYLTVERQFVSKEWADKNTTSKLQTNDILLTAAAHGPKWIGLKVDIFEGLPPHLGNEALFTAELMACRVDKESGYDPYYILLFLRSAAGYAELQRCIRGQSGHIYSDAVSDIKIPVPNSRNGVLIQQAVKKLRRAVDVSRGSEELGK